MHRGPLDACEDAAAHIGRALARHMLTRAAKHAHTHAVYDAFSVWRKYKVGQPMPDIGDALFDNVRPVQSPGVCLVAVLSVFGRC